MAMRVMRRMVGRMRGGALQSERRAEDICTFVYAFFDGIRFDKWCEARCKNINYHPSIFPIKFKFYPRFR